MTTTLETIGQRAREAARTLATAGTLIKNKALFAIANALEENIPAILAANQKDLDSGKQAGLTNALLDRLALSPDRIRGMADGVRQVAAADDPIGTVLNGRTLPNGLRMEKVRVPLGVIGIIYEARPNVTSDAAVLCLKSGNAAILRGGKEAFHSNQAIACLMQEALRSAGLPSHCIQLIEDTSRETATAMMKLNQYLDVLIPRGGAGLIRAVVENSTVPVIETGTGNCHVYVEQSADFDMAAQIIYNAKTQRPSVCNAIETVLVDQSIASAFLPLMADTLAGKSVEIRGCGRTKAVLPSATPATEEDYATEFLDYILAVKVVNDIDGAIAHIDAYSSGHSECILTKDYAASEKFIASVDCAAVYVNASTRFTDGGEFGLGAEIGISTQKLHARGPMGLCEMTSMKYIIRGDGQIR